MKKKNNSRQKKQNKNLTKPTEEERKGHRLWANREWRKYWQFQLVRSGFWQNFLCTKLAPAVKNLTSHSHSATIYFFSHERLTFWPSSILRYFWLTYYRYRHNFPVLIRLFSFSVAKFGDFFSGRICWKWEDIIIFWERQSTVLWIASAGILPNCYAPAP